MSPEAETALKDTRTYGPSNDSFAHPTAHNHFGLIVVSCDRADLRPLPGGVFVYGNDAQHYEALPPPVVPRAARPHSYGGVGPGHARGLPRHPRLVPLGRRRRTDAAGGPAGADRGTGPSHGLTRVTAARIGRPVDASARLGTGSLTEEVAGTGVAAIAVTGAIRAQSS